MVGSIVEAWEYDPCCELSDVMQLAAARVAEPTFAGALLSTRGDALTVQVLVGSPTADPRSLFYVGGHGAFALARLEAWPPLPGGSGKRFLVTLVAYPPARAEVPASR
ncbi:hypothetical protein [Anaeromyxobacter diazotrophicus]|uniref:Uncharacterized protein n=1 Tax=Anaeromyxobacter diazotrophicus TaxID=2590199 RepID=A0A7I9VJ56_9BACT|nr:hypothetical protein [Anaeromyxobacter diazotrophicus]GEJ56393.1 hypothetical protein AMYX_11340 [Anaeromyxobacter diazotrophicus]